jgi:putative ABC transport system permease protein
MNLSNDLQFALRTLTRAPGFTALAVGVLALGIGATTVIYGVLKGVVLDPLPVPEQERLVVVRETNPPQFPQFSVSPGNYMSWRSEVKAFEHLSMASNGWFNLVGRAEPARLRGAIVTPEYFATIGVPAALGRTFSPDHRAEDGQVVVLAHGAWMTHFGGDIGIVGRSVTLNDKSYTVLGVMPPSFRLSSASNDLYTP